MQTRNRQHCNITCFCFTSRSLLQDILLFSRCLCPVSHLLKCRFVGVLPNLLISQLSPSYMIPCIFNQKRNPSSGQWLSIYNLQSWSELLAAVEEDKTNIAFQSDVFSICPFVHLCVVNYECWHLQVCFQAALKSVLRNKSFMGSQLMLNCLIDSAYSIKWVNEFGFAACLVVCVGHIWWPSKLWSF